MKYLKFLLVLLLFMPLVALAKINNVEVVSVERIEKSPDVIVSSDEEFSNSTINFNLKFFEVGDYVTYKVVIKNTSGSKINVLEDEDVLETKYLSFEASLEDLELEVDEETDLMLTVKYINNVEREDIENGFYTDEQNLDINIVNGELIVSNTGVVDKDEIVPDNPLTRDFIIGVALICGVSLIMYVVFKKKRVAKYTLLLVLLLPMWSTAVDSIKVASSIELRLVKPNPCTYEGNLTNGVTYEKEQYVYTYYASDDGWLLGLKDRNSTDPVTSKMCTTINDKPIVSMSGAFASSKATSIDLSSFDTSNVTSMSGMFNSATNIKELDFITFDTRNVLYFSSMFGSASSLEELDLSGFEAPKLQAFESMFYNVNKVKELDLSGFDTSKVSSFSGLFSGMSSLETLNLSNWDLSLNTGNNVFTSMFSGSPVKHLKIDNVKLSANMYGGFAGCSYLEDVSMENIDTSELTNMSGLFYGTKLKEVDVSNWDTSRVTAFDGIFGNISTLEKVNMTGWDFSKFPSYSLFTSVFSGIPGENLKSIDLTDAKFAPNMSNAFNGFKYVEELNLTNVDTSNVTNMSGMFSGMEAITSLDVSSFDTSKVTVMYNMFYNTRSLGTLDLSSFDISKVTSSDYMFSGTGATKGYAKDQTSANFFNSVAPSTLRFSVKS